MHVARLYPKIGTFYKCDLVQIPSSQYLPSSADRASLTQQAKDLLGADTNFNL